MGAACAHSLTEILWILIDASAPVRPEEMRRLRTFLTDGARSPLYRDDPEQARRTAHGIATAFVLAAARAPRDRVVTEAQHVHA